MYGITSGLRSSADTAAMPRNRRRVRASDARMPSVTAPMLERTATIALVRSAVWRSESWRNWRYQSSVKPLSGKVGRSESLNEKISRIRIGA